ncbi:hypothetical protein D3C81_1316830 [compost metagenome]
MSKTFLYGKAINFTLNKLFTKLNIAFDVIWVCFLGEFHFRHFFLGITHDFCQCIVRLNTRAVKVCQCHTQTREMECLIEFMLVKSYFFC